MKPYRTAVEWLARLWVVALLLIIATESLREAIFLGFVGVLLIVAAFLADALDDYMEAP